MNVVNLDPNKALKILITTEKPKNLPCRGFVWYLNLNGETKLRKMYQFGFA